jgi:hypothetical protein
MGRGGEGHYFGASLPAQFDSWIWFDQTSAVARLPVGEELLSAPFGR